MTLKVDAFSPNHQFLGASHDENARRTLWVVVLTFVMMIGEIGGDAEEKGPQIPLLLVVSGRAEEAQEGLLGQVVEVASRRSTALLLTDPDHAVPVIVRAIADSDL